MILILGNYGHFNSVEWIETTLEWLLAELVQLLFEKILRLNIRDVQFPKHNDTDLDTSCTVSNKHITVFEYATTV